MGTLTVKEGAMTALSSKYSRGFHMATEAEDDQRTLYGREIWRRRCGQQDTSEGLEEDGGDSTEQS